MSDRPVTPRYVRVDERDVHFHVIGRGRPLVMLHASPGSSRTLIPLARALAGWQVLAFDTAGCGRSDPLAASRPSIDDYARATLAVMDRLGLPRCPVYGTHTGAKIALALAHLAPERIGGLILDGLGISTDAERREQLSRYTPRHVPRQDGTHLVSVWHQVRDMTLFWPWYRQTASAVRVNGPAPRPETIQGPVVDMLGAHATFPALYRAAFDYCAERRLEGVTVPTRISARPGDPLAAGLGDASPRSPLVNIRPAAFAAGLEGQLDLLRALAGLPD